MSKPKEVKKAFTHEPCTGCKFVCWYHGNNGWENVWICTSKDGRQTLLFRYGNDPHEYKSYGVDDLGGKPSDLAIY